MPNPPYSAAVLIIRENQDGFAVEFFHWDEMSENANVPPHGPINHILTQAGVAGIDSLSFHKFRTASTKADLASKLTSYITQKFPDSP